MILSKKQADDSLRLTVYHNVHAGIPLAPDLLRLPPIRQFTLESKTYGHFQEWLEI